MEQRFDFDLDLVLIKLSARDGTSTWTAREAVEGVQIFGGIGSGKTSGSGKKLALKYLSCGFGGLVLTAKIEERDLWIDYCSRTNRMKDLVVIEPGGKYFFNFLEYESTNLIGGISITENIVQVLKTVIRASEEKSGGKNDDPFWESALDMLIFNVIDLCNLAVGQVSVQAMYEIVMTAPKRKKLQDESVPSGPFMEAYNTAQVKVQNQVNSFTSTLPDEEKAKLVDTSYFERTILENIPDAVIFKSVDQFFMETYRDLSEKTRSIIEFVFSGFLFRLTKEPFKSLFCGRSSNITPEDSLEGKIILINLPVKLYQKVGRDCQVMFKYIWQRAMERRDMSQNNWPVFLWADEAQHFIHEYDAEYQATARSSRIATVYISQNIPNYHANMGGLKSEFRVKSFLGTLGTKIFHSNADIETNRYASELIGEGYTEDNQASATVAGDFSSTRSISYKLEKMVRPEEFTGLKTGGPRNQFIVESYMILQSKPFHDGMNFRKIAFNQH